MEVNRMAEKTTDEYLKANQDFTKAVCECAREQAKKLGLTPIEAVRLLRSVAETYPNDGWCGLPG